MSDERARDLISMYCADWVTDDTTGDEDADGILAALADEGLVVREADVDLAARLLVAASSYEDHNIGSAQFHADLRAAADLIDGGAG